MGKYYLGVIHGLTLLTTERKSLSFVEPKPPLRKANCFLRGGMRSDLTHHQMKELILGQARALVESKPKPSPLGQAQLQSVEIETKGVDLASR